MLKTKTGMKISGGEAVEALLPFTRIIEPQSVMSKVAFRDGYAYAGDKRIVAKVGVCAEPTASVEDYPFAAVDRLVDPMSGIGDWYRVCPNGIEGLTKTFLEKVASEAEESAHETRGRYVSVECPRCGEPMLFDLDRNILVEEMERFPFDPKIVPFYGCLRLGDANVNVGFGYVYTAYRTAGEGLMFSAMPKSRENPQMLAMKTGDGLFRATLMPLTVGPDFEPEWSIDCVGV